MAKMPWFRDYSGHAYNRRGRRAKHEVRADDPKVRSFHCADCKTRRYCTLTELGRASRPRCLACGGPLVESEASEKRVLGGKRERKERNRFAVKVNPVKCWACGTGLGSPTLMAAHLVNNQVCRKDYVADNRFVEYDGKLYFPDAFSIVCADRGTYRWQVWGVEVKSGKQEMLTAWAVRYRAEGMIADLQAEWDKVSAK